MKNISNWIDNIIEDLVNPNLKLSDTLLKVQALAFRIDNVNLKIWVENEIKGYVGKEIPEYRKIPTAIMGNMILDAGYRGVWTKKNCTLPVENLDIEIRHTLLSIKIDSSVAEFQKMIESQGTYHVTLPHMLCNLFSQKTHPWIVDSVWRVINLNSIEGILTTIKSTLLNFLLELNKEFGDNDNLSIMKKKKEVNEIFNKTIGSISGEQINISLGNNSVQAINYGEKSIINAASGENVNQNISNELKTDIEEFLNILKENLENLDLSKSDTEDVRNEMTRIDSQIKREQPKINIIGAALNTINGILIGIAGNAFTPIVLGKLNELIGRF